jgi:hypothetical protein
VLTLVTIQASTLPVFEGKLEIVGIFSLFHGSTEQRVTHVHVLDATASEKVVEIALLTRTGQN